MDIKSFRNGQTKLVPEKEGGGFEVEGSYAHASPYLKRLNVLRLGTDIGGYHVRVLEMLPREKKA